MNGRFQPGDTRINRAGRPKTQRVADAIGGAISTADIATITNQMKMLALAGDTSAGQAVAMFLIAGQVA